MADNEISVSLLDAKPSEDEGGETTIVITCTVSTGEAKKTWKITFPEVLLGRVFPFIAQLYNLSTQSSAIAALLRSESVTVLQADGDGGADG